MNADTKKRGLGRGLDALFRDAKSEEAAFQPKIRRADEMVAAAQAVQSGAAAPAVTALAASPTVAAPTAPAAQRKLPVDKLTPGKFQPRRFFDDAALDQLADSISTHGVLQPLLVRPLGNSMFEIIAGERRWRAAQKAQLHELPVVVQELDDRQALEIGLIENLQREDLSAVEEAEGYQRLMDEFGHTQDVLAQHLGKSRSHIANTLRLLKLPASVRAMVQNGTLSAGHARALVGAKDPAGLADAIQKRGLSVRQTEKLVQQAAEGKARAVTKKKSAFIQKDVDILALEQRTTSQLGLKVAIDDASGQGRLIIEYKSLDQLDDVLARLAHPARRG